MKFSIPIAAGQSYEAYAYTGGKAFDPSKPTVVFIHGVLHTTVSGFCKAAISRTMGTTY